MTVVLESLGIVIFVFDEHPHRNVSQMQMRQVAELAAGIADDTCHLWLQRCQSIFVARVILGSKEKEIAKPVYEGPFTFTNVSLTEETFNVTLWLQDWLKNCLDMFYSQGNAGTSSYASNKFTARLFLLQNLENEDNLIHKRIQNQSLGKDGFF